MRKNGFTFVEILISLAVTALLAGTICSALIHVAGIERRTEQIRETPFYLQTLVCRSYLSQTEPDAIADDVPREWLVRQDEEIIDADSGKIPWMTWSVAPSDDPTFGYAVSLRDGLGSWR